MTGFGKQVVDLDHLKMTIEIRALNSKQLDINCRIPNSFKEYELDIRNIISEGLERGKIDCNVAIEQTSAKSASVINKELAKHYINEIRHLGQEEKLNTEDDLLSNVLRIPEIFTTPEHVVDEKELSALKEGVKTAVNAVDEYRKKEGQSLESDFIERAKIILRLLEQVNPYETERAGKIKERIRQNLSQTFDNNMQVDENRFEQEVIFYLEKLDITEEKIRLEKNCDYFLETLQLENSSGKKLGFISQEIGREVNTLGSKANDADIQKLVVLMKDELEKIKEQLFNIL